MIPEVVNQVAFLVIGHDLTVTLCAEGGQLPRAANFSSMPLSRQSAIAS